MALANNFSIEASFKVLKAVLKEVSDRLGIYAGAAMRSRPRPIFFMARHTAPVFPHSEGLAKTMYISSNCICHCTQKRGLYAIFIKKADFSEDEEEQKLEDIQNITDKFNKQVDENLKAKETELMQI